ncbi:MAG: SUMF1/EgtB/PvdO family nonheme iron enzyme [Elusimicrobia bacterium]|nr:SUMF1/EgtB/PvdO family nonheme iron enzyme [Elusimicrobiota bacterium]
MSGPADRRLLEEHLQNGEAAYEAGRRDEAAAALQRCELLLGEVIGRDPDQAAEFRARIQRLKARLAQAPGRKQDPGTLTLGDAPAPKPAGPGTLTMGPGNQGTLTMGPGGQGTLTMGPEGAGAAASQAGSAPSGPHGPSGAGEGRTSAPGWREGMVIDGLYEVQGLLGEGGFGSVHKVRHLGWRMDLAVKSPRADRVSNRRAMERFVQEANTWVGLGLHPNIVTCYFVRLIGGLPRIFIECVEGGSFSDWLSERKVVDAKTAMDVSIQLARAMEASHGKGLIHRDLKPGNCLMTPGGTLKVTDFGLAKAGTQDETPDPGVDEGPEPDSRAKKAKAREAAMTGRLGTPEYMAPEQWHQAGKAAASADVWAFGVMLHELMCGRRPFTMEEGEPPDAFYCRMLESNWACKFRQDAPEELKSIVAACLRPEPRRREARFSILRSRLEALYQDLFREPYPREVGKETALLADSLSNQGVSMADLGKTEEALRLFGAALKQDPAHPGAIYNRGVLLMREGKAEAGEFVVELAASRKARPGEWPPVYLSGLLRLAGGLVGGAVRDFKEAGSISSSNPLIRKALKAAEESRLEEPLDYFMALPMGAEAAAMEESLFNSLLARAGKEREAGRLAKAYEALMKARGIKGYERSPVALELQRKLGLKGWAKGLRGGWQRLLYDGSKDALSVAVSPDGSQAISGHEDKTARVWELETGRLLKTLEGHAGAVTAVCFLADRARALSASKDGSVRVWDVGTGQCLRTLVGHAGAVNAVCCLPGGRQAMSAGDDGALKLRDLDSGPERFSVHAHDGPVIALAVSSEGLRAFTAGGADGFLKCWDLASGRMLKADSSAGKVHDAATSSSQPWLLLACEDGRLVRWLPGTGPVSSVQAHEGPARSVRFTPEGRHALSGGDDKALKLWDLGGDECVWTAEGHRAAMTAACFSPDARYVLSAGRDGLRLWELDWKFEFPERNGQAGKAAQPSPRGSAGQGDLASKAKTVYYALAGVGIAAAISLVIYLAVAPDKAPAPSQGAAFDARPKQASTEGRQTEPAPPPGPSAQESVVKAAQPEPRPEAPAPAEPAKPTGQAVDGRKETAVLLQGWNVIGRGWLGNLNIVGAIAFSPDSKHALLGCSDNTMRLWEVARGTEIARWEGHSKEVSAVVFSPDGATALSASPDMSLRLWEVSTGKPIAAWQTGTSSVTVVAISPDGRMALSAGKDRSARLWDLGERKMIRQWPVPAPEVKAVAFSPDGRRAIIATQGPAFQSWDTDSGKLLFSRIGHTSLQGPISFSNDARKALIGFLGSFRLWDIASFKEINDWGRTSQQNILENALSLTMAISPDGTRILSAGALPGSLPNVRLWSLPQDALLATNPRDSVPDPAGQGWIYLIPGTGWQVKEPGNMTGYAHVFVKDYFVWQWRKLEESGGAKGASPIDHDAEIYIGTHTVASGQFCDPDRNAYQCSRNGGTPLGTATGGSHLGRKSCRSRCLQDKRTNDSYQVEYEDDRIISLLLIYNSSQARQEGLKAFEAMIATLKPRLGDDQLREAIRLSRTIKPAVKPSEPAAAGKAVPSGKAGIQWVRIPGGTFMMGTDEFGKTPRHSVKVKSFQLAKTEVTNKQYKACVEAGACTSQGSPCESYSSADDQPVVYVDWNQAKAFAAWVGGRLPSEAEWEYAARSAGKDWKYPWGDEQATCARAVMDDGGRGCGRNSTWPVCSKTAGNTEQGLCDMVGNVWEWTQDWYHHSYNGAPSDGSARESPTGSARVTRSGAGDFGTASLSAALRSGLPPGLRDCYHGLRPAR